MNDNTINKIDELYAFISVKDNGNEGIMAEYSMPMITGALSNLQHMKRIMNEAREVAPKDTTIKLVRFTSAEIMEF